MSFSSSLMTSGSEGPHCWLNERRKKMSSVIEETQVTPSGTQLGLTKAQQKKIVLYISVSGRVQIPGRLIELPAQRPRKLASHIQFGLLRGPHLRIKKPIQLTILRKRGSVVAHWKEIDEFGYGRN